MSALIVMKPLLARLGQNKLAESLEVRPDGGYIEDEWVLGSSQQGEEMVVVAMHCQTKWAFLVGSFARRQDLDLAKAFYSRLTDSLLAWGIMEDQTRSLFGGREQLGMCRTRDATLMGQAAAAALECEVLAEALSSQRRRVDDAEFLILLNQRRVKALRGATPMELFDSWLSERGQVAFTSTDTLVFTSQDVADLGKFWALFDRYADRDKACRSLAEIEGFMCAVLASPGQLYLLQTLQGLLGTDETNWESVEDLNAVLGEFARWSNHTVAALGGRPGSFSPMFVTPSNRIDTVEALDWCKGFARGWMFKCGEFPVDELRDAVFLIVSQAVAEQPETSSDFMTIDGQRLAHGPAGIAPAVEWLFKTCQKRSDWV